MAYHSHSHQTGKELLFAALRHEELTEVPWVPFAGVHAGKLKGYTGEEILTDGSKLLQSLLEVNRVYDPDGQTTVFDLQVEAEILGCKLVWAKYAPPSVASHPLAAELIVPVRLPEKGDGRLPFILQAMSEMKQAVGEHTGLYGLVTGPFTLASHLRGTEIFMDMIDHPEYVDALLAYTGAVSERMADFYIEAGMDVIAAVDPVVSQISPRHFKRFLSLPFTRFFNAVREQKVFSSFFVCGDATKNLEVMCQTCPDSISVDENIDMVTAKQVTDRYNITLGGNIPLTTRMLLGSQQDNMAYVVELLDKLTHRNLIIAPGCDMPYDTPVENVIGVVQAVRSPESTRQLLSNYHAAEFNLDVELPDYASLKRPLVEVFTVDSATCAACGYMLQAAQRVAEQLTGQVDVMEYKITQPENVARIKKMGVQHLPAIFINGELKFSSIIPSNQELVDAVIAAK
jgi:uroporphyrinogen decarboxylase